MQSSRRMCARVIVVVVGWLAAACSAPDRPLPLDALRAADTTGKDLILVMSDTHRLDHVGGFDDGAAELTPALARFTANGVGFTGALTPVPISAPAYATLMTGLLPTEHGLLNNEQHLGAEHSLLQERLRGAGYRTGAVIGNPYCSAGHGFGRGFDDFWDSIEDRGNHGEIVTDEVVRWLDSVGDHTPIFLFAAYMDAHTPYIADGIPPSLRVEVNGRRVADVRAENAHVVQRFPLTLGPGRNTVELRFLDNGSPATPDTGDSPLHLRGLRLASGRTIGRTTGLVDVPGTGFRRLANRTALDITNPGDETVEDELVFHCYRKYRHENIPAFYRAGVRGFDRAFGRLVDELRRRGRWDDAVVIFVSDHGEMLGEHDAWGHVEHLYQECLRVPLVIRAPGVEAGLVDDRRLGLRDLHDLMLELALGHDPNRRAAIEARRAAPFIAATYPPEGGRLQIAAIEGDRKVVIDETGAHHAFDLVADPGERQDLLAANRPDPVSEALLAAASAELGAASGIDTLDLETLSDEERDRLRALGYLD